MNNSLSPGKFRGRLPEVFPQRIKDFLHKTADGIFMKAVFASVVVYSNCFPQVTMEIGSGSTVEVSNFIGIHLSGDWISTGVFTAGKGEVVFNGSERQIINSGGEENFYNLKISKPNGGLSVFNNLSVQNRLEITKGIINANGSVISLSEGASVKRDTGYIIGTLRQSVSPGHFKRFDVGTLSGYSPVIIKVNSGKGDLSVKASEGSHVKVIGTSVLQRYWTLLGTGVSRAELQFQYLPQDVSGIENDYVAGLYNEKWSFPTADIDPVNHMASVSGVLPYGDWTFGLREALSQAQIKLAFTISAGSVNLFWHVPTELNVQGFVLERADYWLKDWKPVADKDKLVMNTAGGGFSYSDNPSSGRFLYRLKQIDTDGNEIYSDEIEVALELPGSFSLQQNFPNPFNSETKITYTIPSDARVNLMIYNITGQKIADLVDEYQAAGQYTVSFDASNLSSGTYLYKIIAGSKVQTKKMILLR